MRKILSSFLCALMIMVIMTSCMSNNNNADNSNTGLENSSAEANSAQNTPDTSNFIGEEKAKDIALERAGINAEGVIFDRVELDRDDGVWHYEVELRQNKNEFDLDIKADDGTVLSFEKDYND